MIAHTIDLNFFTPETIASYLIETDSELALIESGPDSVYGNLIEGIKKLGFDTRDVRKVFVTHVHLDHAGAAWHFADNGATIYVHPNGARHLNDPSKLVNSASRIYKERMGELWGRVNPISQDRLHQMLDGEEVAVGDTVVRAVDTQGHASHHNTYFVEGNAFTGDVGGIRIKNGPVFPPTPAPDINVEIWLSSIEKIRRLKPAAIYPTHFGKSTDVVSYLDELRARLLDWTGWVGDRLREGKDEAGIISEFDSYVTGSMRNSGLDQEMIDRYRNADPFWMNVPGLIRYWNKYRLNPDN